MIEWLFIILVILAFVFMALAIEFRDDLFWGMTFTLLSITTWFILAASVMEIEIPYQAFNSTSGQVETGYQVFSGKTSPQMVFFFIMMASIMIIYFVKFLFGPALFGKFFPNRSRFKR